MKKALLLLLGGYLANNANAQVVTMTYPRLVVYKTKANYRDLIPVALSEDKSRIISYPGTTDVKLAEGYMKPSKLKKGYLLDNQGIGKNVAFLGITYEEYAKMGKTLSRDEMFAKIVDKDPLLELYDCGERKGEQSSLIKSLKKSIRKKKLSDCNKIK